MRKFAQVKEFFTKDPLGRNLRALMKDFAAICQTIRLRARAELKQYLTNLLKDN